MNHGDVKPTFIQFYSIYSPVVRPVKFPSPPGSVVSSLILLLVGSCIQAAVQTDMREALEDGGSALVLCGSPELSMVSSTERAGVQGMCSLSRL